jgi:hypothetical protein
MSTATLTIGRNERDTLHWLMARRLFVMGQDPPALAASEGANLDQLAKEFGEDLELMSDLGWEVDDDRKTVALTMPAERLGKAIKRLRRDARRAPCEKPREHEPKEANDERWKRFRAGVDTCEELLDLLDNRDGGEAEDASAAEADADEPCGCAAFLSAEDRLLVDPSGLTILAAIERAARHQGSDEIDTVTVTEHLGLDPDRRTARTIGRRLDGLRDDSELTRIEREHGEGWVLTSEGRKRLDEGYAAEKVGDLPESPQHRAWREARVQAAVRIEEFEGELGTILEEAGELLNRYGRPGSSEWFALSERLSPAAWRLGSATHCLLEWVEPDDDLRDEDENPGPSPGRRAISVWDETSIQIGGPA